jgi:hypothetical protein
MLSRLAVIRQPSLSTLVVKEPNEPRVFIIKLSEPLSDAQLRRLVVASPWNPVMIEAVMGPWDSSDNTFDAEIQTVECMPKIPPPLKPKRKCDARKQHSRMLQLN